MATESLHFRCHCSSLTTTLDVPLSSFPLTVTNCHCWTSRAVSGNMCTSNIVTTSILPEPAIPLSNPNLKGYSCSPTVTRYFCSKCGAHALSVADEGGGVMTRKIAVGMIDEPTKPTRGMFEWDGHMWLCDTYDGGVAEKWTDHSGSSSGKMKRWWTWVGTGEKQVEYPYPKQAQLPESRSTTTAQEQQPEEEEKKLRAKCRCGGVDFSISRPPPKNKQQPDDNCFWIKGNRWLTQACVCSSCRRTSGYPVSFWTYISKQAGILTLPDGAPVPDTLLFGTIQRYDSSPGVERYFCSNCGASVFYRQTNSSCGFMDVATGLLAREGEGSRKEDWLYWDKSISFPEEGEDKGLVDALKKGFAVEL